MPSFIELLALSDSVTLLSQLKAARTPMMPERIEFLSWMALVMFDGYEVFPAHDSTRTKSARSSDPE
ncbi:MAG TPA: hypothetical protein VGM18_04990 [Candidatus Sulfotelmatobacter sp.]